MLTRQHFETIAAGLLAARPEFHGVPHNTSEYHVGARDQWNYTVAQIGNQCRASNPRFDRARFIDACGGLF